MSAGTKVAIDYDGNIVLVGSENGLTGLSSVGAHQTLPGGNVDAFLMKFTTNCVLIWATYYGGSEIELGDVDMDIDVFNNIYIAGTTYSSNNIATPGSYQSTNGGTGDVFVAKFNSAGNRQWGTYYGGNGDEDWPPSIVIDPFGSFFISGPAGSQNYFATSGAFQMNANGGRDVFLAKFNGSGQRVWGTYFGGDSDEENGSLATDSHGNVILTGSTLSTNNISTIGSFQDSFGSLFTNVYDAFIQKFSATGTRMWGTYFGGPGDDYIVGVLTSNDNIVFDAVTTRSGIASSGAYCTTLNSNTSDGYLASFDSSGTLTTPVPELSGPATSLIKVFPNPTNDIVQRTLPSMSEGTITISDAMGRLVKTVTVKTQELTIDLKGLAAGVYLLEYKSEQMSETVKLIKE